MKEISLPTNYNKLSTVKRREVRQTYIELQKGICIVCNNPLSKQPSQLVMEHPIQWDLFPDYFLKHPIHLHHDHATGMTIGAIHAYCNAYSWQYKQT